MKKDTNMTTNEQDKLRHPSSPRALTIRNAAIAEERKEIAEFLLSERGRDVVLDIWKDDTTIFEAIARVIADGAR